MSDQTIKADLDPQKVLDALREMGSKSEDLAKQIEESLGKDAAKSVKKLEEASEKGSSNIGNFFSNLGKKIQGDLKAAFDFSRVLAGIKFTDEIAKGAKQVLDMERSFDRLNVRIGASREAFSKFKTDLGKSSAATGANLEKVLPGVEAVASRGGVKDTGQLAQIGEMLAKAQAATGEDTQGIGENISEALKARNEAVTPQSFKAMLDASMAARNAGAFHSVGESSAAILDISSMTKRMGMSSRESAGLAAQASTAGAPGMGALKSLLEMGSGAGGHGLVNSLLGQNVFNHGKLDTQALSKVNLSRGGLKEQQAAKAFGFSGANAGEDFIQFINAFKKGNQQFKQVINGSNETAEAFDKSSQNFASRIDRFKESLANSGREVVGGLSEAAEGALSGHGKHVVSGLKHAGAGVMANAGTIAGGVGGTLAMGLLFGGGLKSLMKGGVGTAKGVAQGAALKGVGVESVFVVNANEIGDASGGALEKGGAFAKIGELSKSLGPIGMGLAALTAGGAAGAALADSDIGKSFRDSMRDMFGPGKAEQDAQKFAKDQEAFRAGKSGLDPQAQGMIDAVRKGMETAKVNVIHKGPMTTNSLAPKRSN